MYYVVPSRLLSLTLLIGPDETEAMQCNSHTMQCNSHAMQFFESLSWTSLAIMRTSLCFLFSQGGPLGCY